MTNPPPTMTTQRNWREHLDSILEGIEHDELEHKEGWWETSTGAEFGKKKKDELIKLFAQVESEAYSRALEAVPEERNPVHYILGMSEDNAYNKCRSEVLQALQGLQEESKKG